MNDETSDGEADCAPTMLRRKTVFLVRHAESLENEKSAALRRFFLTALRGRVPALADLRYGLSLLTQPDLIDTPLSDAGRAQVETLSQRMRDTNFLRETEVQLVMHSPLVRAKETCGGVLRSWAAKHAPAFAVEELEVAREKTVQEWIPGYGALLDARVAEFGRHLLDRPEERVLVVGHSQFFKHMLRMGEKFKNCDVWRVRLEDRAGSPAWTEPTKVLHVFDELPPGAQGLSSEVDTKETV